MKHFITLIYPGLIMVILLQAFNPIEICKASKAIRNVSARRGKDDGEEDQKGKGLAGCGGFFTIF